MISKSIKFTSVFVATIALMLFSQGGLAYAADTTCEDETLSGVIEGNVFVKGICEFDGLELNGDVKMEEEDSVLIVYGASIIRGSMELKGEFNEVYFEGISQINRVTGDIKAEKASSYIFIESLTMDGSVHSKGGDVYINSDNRFSGVVTMKSELTTEGDGTSDLTVVGGTFLDNVIAKNQNSIRLLGSPTDEFSNISSVDDLESIKVKVF